MGLNRFFVTVTYSYDVPDADLLSDYDSMDLEEAASIDQGNLYREPYYISEQFNEATDAQVVVRAERV